MERPGEPEAEKSWIKEYLITILLLVGAVLGFGLGILLIFTLDDKYKSRIIMTTGFPGELLRNGYECMALPLAVSGIVLTITSMVFNDYFILLTQSLIYLVLIKIEASFLGVTLAVFILSEDVNTGSKISQEDAIPTNYTSVDFYLDGIRHLFPSNVITMTMMRYRTELIPDNKTKDKSDWEVDPRGVVVGGTNVYGLILYTFLFSAALNFLLNRADELKSIFETLNYMGMMITRWLLYVAPLLSISVIAADVVEAKYSNYLGVDTAWLIVTIVIAHVIQCFFVYPLLYFTLIWENPFTIWKYPNSLLTAFIMKSSWVIFPVLVVDLQKKEEISPKLFGLVLPVIQALNKSGSAIYFTAAAVFMYRVNGMEINFLSLLKIAFAGALTSFVGSDIPYKNILSILMMVDLLGLPIENVPLMLAVDWIAARSANLVNVLENFYLIKILNVYNNEMLSEK